MDDEPTVLELQLAILDSLGATAVGADCGAAAIEQLGQREFDLVVSDLRMPGKPSGKDLHEWVRVNHPRTAFIFVTGEMIEETEFLERAGAPFLLKPFDMTDYIELLQRSLRDARAA